MDYTYREHIGETHIDGTPHQADPHSITYAYDNDDSVVCDIWCNICGQSGSFRIMIGPDAADIHWM